MKKSALQKARAAYQPKLPVVLTGAVKAVEGKPTHSVADQDDIRLCSPTPTVSPKSSLRKTPTPLKARHQST